jgi:hypothetical protein
VRSGFWSSSSESTRSHAASIGILVVLPITLESQLRYLPGSLRKGVTSFDEISSLDPVSSSSPEFYYCSEAHRIGKHFQVSNDSESDTRGRDAITVMVARWAASATGPGRRALAISAVVLALLALAGACCGVHSRRVEGTKVLLERRIVLS